MSPPRAAESHTILTSAARPPPGSSAKKGGITKPGLGLCSFKPARFQVWRDVGEVAGCSVMADGKWLA